MSTFVQQQASTAGRRLTCETNEQIISWKVATTFMQHLFQRSSCFLQDVDKTCNTPNTKTPNTNKSDKMTTSLDVNGGGGADLTAKYQVFTRTSRILIILTVPEAGHGVCQAAGAVGRAEERLAGGAGEKCGAGGTGEDW